MKVGAPINGFIKANAPHGSISQYFGENPALYSTICHPVDGVKTCMIGHNGIDIVAPWFTPILSVCDGVVSDVKDSPSGYGKHVRVSGGGREWTYGHLAEIKVVKGQSVSEGQILGNMGNTGMVYSAQNLNDTMNGLWKPNSNKYYGTHLHLGCRLFDKFGTIIDYKNGYFGSFDFIDMLPDNGINKEEYENEKVSIFMKQFIWALKKIGYVIK